MVFVVSDAEFESLMIRVVGILFFACIIQVIGIPIRPCCQKKIA